MTTPEMRQEITAEIMRAAKRAVDQGLEIIISELPNGQASPIASQIYAEQTSKDEITIFTETPVWGYLNDGTGIYNPENAGAGPGGSIIPTHGKALHFKNILIAAALGFQDENVFLRKVKGIKPRYFFERTFETSLFTELFQDALSKD